MAIVHQFPEISPQPVPPWDADNITAIMHAKDLARRGVTAGEAYGAVSSCPEYLPVAEALEGLNLAGVADSGVEAIIRAAARR